MLGKFFFPCILHNWVCQSIKLIKSVTYKPSEITIYKRPEINHGLNVNSHAIPLNIRICTLLSKDIFDFNVFDSRFIALCSDFQSLALWIFSKSPIPGTQPIRVFPLSIIFCPNFANVHKWQVKKKHNTQSTKLLVK